MTQNWLYQKGSLNLKYIPIKNINDVCNEMHAVAKV